MSIPPNVWHQAVVIEDKDWVVVSFHTVPADELIEERPDTADSGRTHQRRYLTPQSQNKALVRRLKNARFKLNASVEDIDYRHPRRLDRQLIRTLSGSDWVRFHHNLLVTGPCGVGKSYMACALAQKAVRDGFTALYVRAPRLFRDLAVARADGSFGKLLDRFSRIDVLIVDDWAMAPLADSERRDFLEICDDRYSIRSTVLTSQVPISHWHDQIGDPTLADSILDRLVHNAHRIELAGASMRKSKNGKTSPEAGDTK